MCHVAHLREIKMPGCGFRAALPHLGAEGAETRAGRLLCGGCFGLRLQMLEARHNLLREEAH